MKRLFLTVAVFCISFVILQAQFSARAGLNIGKNEFSINGTSLTTGPLYGFNAGFEGDFKIAGPLYINAGLLYTQKGTEFELIYKGTMTIEYIEVPLNMKVKFDAGPINLFAQAGVYGAYAIGNKLSYDKEGMDDYSFDYGTDKDEIDRMDYGFDVGVGAGFSKISLLFSYEEGFGDIYNAGETILTTAITNKVFSVSATFQF